MKKFSLVLLMLMVSTVAAMGIHVAADDVEDTVEFSSAMELAEQDVIAEGTCGDNLTWTLDDAGTLKIDGTGAMDDYNYISKPWSSYRDSIYKVEIGDGVTSIGGAAFQGCASLTSITIPDGVTSIGSYAFNSCSALTSITIPDDVTSIGSYAFYGCSSLTSITIPDGVTSIWVWTFYGCSSLTSITIPDGVTGIGGFAFYGCSSGHIY